MRYRAIFGREHDLNGLADELLRFRKNLFVDKFGWQLDVNSGKERDQFDTPAAIYCAMLHSGALVGMFRAIRTDHPYLAMKVFSRLAKAGCYPKRQDAWEISRFGVLSAGNDRRHAEVIHALMFHFAFSVSAKSLVAVTDLTYERLLHILGIKTQRYGPAEVIGIDTRGSPLRAVAGEIPLSLQSGKKFERLIGLSRIVEIEDASHVFGHRRISA